MVYLKFLRVAAANCITSERACAYESGATNRHLCTTFSQLGFIIGWHDDDNLTPLRRIK
jgi:hypothetical protein